MRILAVALALALCSCGQRAFYHCPDSSVVCHYTGSASYDVCADLSSDERHCGFCHVVCPIGWSCVDGACVMVAP